ncbi:acyl-CoA dehydrogenase family protein [Qaidamihabitans albus]|uniref:acyl-CoA dehydrogenase family protein n=1 Tax=Qaidamihabitans albus TaxID=2795733 RepID=UPI0018F19FF9|nr:acyl-CoA dehydrogenase family protein [Qaidamihabitans albus]
MRFAFSAEQRQFGTSLDDLLSDVDVESAARRWAAGEHEPGLKLWWRLAEIGVPALAVPEHRDGLGAGAVDVALAFERLGYHGVPGPWVDTAAVLPALLDDELLAGVAAGETLASLRWDPHVPYALDADVADTRIAVEDGTLRVFTPGRRLSSVAQARRLFGSTVGDAIATCADTGRAFDWGVLATSAQLLGAGRWLLERSVEYARQRRQYGRAIGEYQAIKHLLADVATRLELAEPLLYGAAVAMAAGGKNVENLGRGHLARDVSAAKVAAADAAYLAARTGLQVHGAIGYTAEHPLGRWLATVRALAGAWGTQAFHRRRVLGAVTAGRRSR